MPQLDAVCSVMPAAVCAAVHALGVVMVQVPAGAVASQLTRLQIAWSLQWQ